MHSATFGSSTHSHTNTGDRDVFLWKLNDSGVTQWAKKAGGAYYDTGEDVAIDASGNVYVTGGFGYYQGGRATFGTKSLISRGAWDAFVWKLNSSGTTQWATQGGANVHEYGRAIALDGSGNVYVVGYFGSGRVTTKVTTLFGNTIMRGGGQYDGFVWKLNSKGAHQWAKQASGLYREWCRDIAIDASGNVYVTGYFQDKAGFNSALTIDSLTSRGANDGFVWGLNSSGKTEWTQQIGGFENDISRSIAVDGAGKLYAAGYFRDGVRLSGTQLLSSGEQDIFVWQLAPPEPGIAGIQCAPAVLSVSHGTGVNAEVATLTAKTTYLGDNPRISFHLKDFNASTDSFKIEGNKLKTNKAIDYRRIGIRHRLTIVAQHRTTEGVTMTHEKVIFVAIRPPTLTGIRLSGTPSIKVGTAAGTVVGELSATGTHLPAEGAGISYRITDGNTDDLFEIEGVELKVKTTPTNNQVASYKLAITANYTGLTHTTTLRIAVLSPLFAFSAEDEGAFQLYPNPSTVKVYVSGLQAGDQVCVRNAKGQVLWCRAVPLYLELGALPAATYILTIDRKQKTAAQRIIKLSR